MESCRGILEEYFKQDAEPEKAEGKEGDTYESYFENIYNTYLKNENILEKSFREIVNESIFEKIFNEKSSENILENAFKSAAERFGGAALWKKNGLEHGRVENIFYGDKNGLENIEYHGGNRDFYTENKNFKESESIVKLSNGGNDENSIFSTEIEKKDFMGADRGKDALREAFNNDFNVSLGNVESNINRDFNKNALTEVFGNEEGGHFENFNREDYKRYFEETENFGSSILNEYMGGGSDERTINNNISPTINLYSEGKGSDIDIYEIAERITEMLAEAASGEAFGAY